ncbi:putative reverse transcriptase, RNA-dependent DNA polymerase [Tanacetum coccineum]
MVYKTKKDNRGIVVRNKARLVALSYTQEDGIDYDEVFALVARIEGLKIQIPITKVYKVKKRLYRYYIKLLEPGKKPVSTYIIENRCRRELIDKTLLSEGQRKMMESSLAKTNMWHILKKFDFATVKTASTPMETNKALLKDEEAFQRFPHLSFEAFSDSDYANASLDRKSTTGGCQFLGRRLISWQCKKQTIVANSTTKADESTICIVKNPVFHSTTKHIEIRHHFIRDSYEKRLIQVIKIHTDHNVADLLTKAFDVIRFQYLIANETVIKEWEDRMERAATTASSLEAEQDSSNINRNLL